MKKVAINPGERAELQFRFAECWGFLKGALESGVILHNIVLHTFFE
jgi:hypothetical protein